MAQHTYIALLRGINVSGQKKIKMADLRGLLTKAGLSEVKTYIQSGNIVFDSAEESPSGLAALIQKVILDQYGWKVPTLVLTPAELQAAVAGYPWSDKDDRTPEKIYITFLESEPAAENQAAIDGQAYLPEEYLVVGKIIYFYPPNGAGRAKMNNNFFEKKLKVSATTRNWRTTNKLIEMSIG